MMLKEVELYESDNVKMLIMNLLKVRISVF